ncbi:MAG TPA: YraN family protein [Candidatus Acidoferrales bacterium]|nr:YraN family protein [Candidatus Acidoferrales bacterium]
MSRPSNSGKGRRGEELAARHLTACGYRVVARNVRVPGGEIDLVCVDGTTLVFVEVKCRAGSSFGTAMTAVDARKRRKLRMIASDYAQIVAPLARIRFDIVTIDGNRIAVHRNAF